MKQEVDKDTKTNSDRLRIPLITRARARTRTHTQSDVKSEADKPQRRCGDLLLCVCKLRGTVGKTEPDTHTHTQITAQRVLLYVHINSTERQTYLNPTSGRR